MNHQHFVLHREHWSQSVMTALPLLLFFPVALMYIGLVLLIVAWLMSGNFLKKWQAVRISPLFYPNIETLDQELLQKSFLNKIYYCT